MFSIRGQRHFARVQYTEPNSPAMTMTTHINLSVLDMAKGEKRVLVGRLTSDLE